MKVEIREDNVVLTGYVNSVERYSKPIYDRLRGSVQRFVERVKAGTFKKALERNDNVLVLLNHNYDKQIANTKDGTAKLEEDNIGLRYTVTTSDPDVIEKAKKDKLVGCSFGMRVNADELGTEENITSRTITDLDLVEVSILDDTKTPAYYGTSVEQRDGTVVEIRDFFQNIKFDAIEEETRKKIDELYKKVEEERRKIQEEAEETKLMVLVEKVVEKVLEKMNITRELNDDHIDYSDFEERLKKI